MTKTRRLSLILMLALTLCAAGTYAGDTSRQASVPAGSGRQLSLSWPDQGCTFFSGVDGDKVLAGNNEDMWDPLTRVWFIPASEGKHGRVEFGYDDFMPQGGINDQGLVFDGLSLPYQDVVTWPSKQTIADPLSLMDRFLAENATVDEVLSTLSRYNLHGLESSQFVLADRLGNAAIVEGNAVLRKKGRFQVATNFRQSEFPSLPSQCERFNTAHEMLSGADNYTVELFRDTLKATSVASSEEATLYSQVYDLGAGLIYLYQFHDFDHPLVLRVADELAKGPHAATIASLFPGNAELEGWAEAQLRDYGRQLTGMVNRNVDPESLAKYAGEYRMRRGDRNTTARLYVADGQLGGQNRKTLYLEEQGLLPIELLPTADGKFIHLYRLGDQLSLEFIREGDRVVRAQGSFEMLGFVQPLLLEPAGIPSPFSAGGRWLWLGAGAAVLALTGILSARRRRAARRV